MSLMKTEAGAPHDKSSENQADEVGQGFIAPEAPSTPPLTAEDKAHLMAGLSYLGVLFIIPLLFVPKKNHALQFHLRQGIVLFVVEAILSALPFVGWMLLIVPIAASLYGFTQAFAGREWELPLLGKYAKRIKL
jgi:uncharacterized membrane protein